MRGCKIVLPAAPFAGTADELLSYGDGSDPQGDTDNTNRGVTTVHAHKSGDIVHMGNGVELVENGGFEASDDNGDGTILDWSNQNDATCTISDGVLAVNTNTTDTAYVNANFPEVQIIKGVSYEINIHTSGVSPDVRIDNRSTYFYSGSEVGNVKLILNADYSGNFVCGLYCRSTGDDDTATFSNISVTPIEQSYVNIADSAAGELVTDTVKFKQIDYVTNSNVLLLTKTGYITIRGIHSFGPQASNREIAETYGWSFDKGLVQVANLTATDATGATIVYTGEAVIAGLVPSLNCGAYHPVFNTVGSRKFSDDKIWYETADVVNSTYDCLKD